MSDPKKSIDLMDIWAHEGITVDIPLPRSTKNKKKKKTKEVSTTSTFGGKPMIELNPPHPAVQLADQGDADVIQASSVESSVPSSSVIPPESERKRSRDNAATPDFNIKRKKEIIQGKMAEKGMVPSISDLEACQRVGAHGLDPFNELAELLAGEPNKRLEGKIFALNVENRHLEVKLLRVQGELNAYRDQHFLPFSEENWSLKAELEQLRGTKEELEAANKKVTEQQKLLERLPQAEKDIEETRQRAGEAEAREETQKTRVAELAKADGEHRK